MRTPSHRLTGFFLTVVTAVALFSSTVVHPFFYDDIPYVAKNPAIRSLTTIPGAFLHPFSPAAPGLYRPVTTMSYTLQYALFGLDPRGYHATNVLLHAFVSGLLFLFAFRMFRSVSGALATSLLFAVHSVHTEAVAWVSGQSELLAAFFALLSILSFLRFRETKGGISSFFLVLSALLYFLAIGSKEIAAPLPLLLPLIQRLVLSSSTKKSSFMKQYLPYGVFALALALSLILRFVALDGLSVPLLQVRTAGLSFLERMLLMLPVLVHYLRLMVFPVGLRLEYDWTTFPFWMSLGAGFFLFGIGALTTWCWRKGRAGSTSLPAGKAGSPQARTPLQTMGFGIFWFFLFLLPVANIIPIGELVAERFLYLPSIGFCLLVGALVQKYVPRVRAQHAVPLLLILMFFSFLPIRRNAVWSNPETLWWSTLTFSPNAPHALQNLTAILLAKGELKESGQLLERGFAQFPESPLFYFQGGQWALANGDRARAERLFTEALRLARPEDIGFTDLQRGIAFLELGQLPEAVQLFQYALEANPFDPVILNNLGVVQAHLGNVTEAKEFFTQAIALFETESSLNEEDRKNLAGARENLKMLLRSTKN